MVSPIVDEHEATTLLLELEGMGRGLWFAARLARTVAALYGEVRQIRAEHAAALATVTAERNALREERDAARAAALEECAARCDAVTRGADEALTGLPAPGAARRAYLAGRRRGAELCAEAIRKGGQ